MSLNPIANLLKTDAILFWSTYGTKAVAESWTQRLNKQIKSRVRKDKMEYKLKQLEDKDEQGYKWDGLKKLRKPFIFVERS